MRVPDDAGELPGELRRLMNERLVRVTDGMAEQELVTVLGEPTGILTGRAAHEYDEDLDIVYAYRDPYRRHTTHYFGFSDGSLQLRLKETVLL